MPSIGVFIYFLSLVPISFLNWLIRSATSGGYEALGIFLSLNEIWVWWLWNTHHPMNFHFGFFFLKMAFQVGMDLLFISNWILPKLLTNQINNLLIWSSSQILLGNHVMTTVIGTLIERWFKIVSDILSQEYSARAVEKGCFHPLLLVNLY